MKCMTLKCKIIMGVTIFCSIVIIALFFIANFMVSFALDNDNTKGFMMDSVSEPLTDVETWFFNSSEKYSLKSSDDLTLLGHYLPNEKKTNNYVLLVHGYKSGVRVMAPFARDYLEKGWNVLAPEHRAQGNSEGRYIGMGVLEQYDMRLWIDWILKRDPNATIVLHGLSMGAATVMLMSAHEDLPVNVKAIIEDCGYSSVNKQFTDQLKSLFGLPAFPFLNFGSLVSKIRAGYFFEEGNALEAVKKAKVPLLFIHGEEDTFVPFAMVHEVFEAASCEKYLLTVPGAPHAQSVVVDNKGYWLAIENFLNKYIDNEGFEKISKIMQ